ncbi:MAG: thioredoxin domain-containing protein [Endozoicomonas sp.]
MRKAAITFFLIFMMPVSAFAAPATSGTGSGPGASASSGSGSGVPELVVRFVKDTHYEVLPGKKAEKPVVVEAFSIYCPACYRWEQNAIGPLKERLDKQGVEFRQMHVSFMGGYAKQISQVLSVTYGTDKYQTVKMALFKPIQEQQIGDWKSVKDFLATVEKAGLSDKEWKLGLNAQVVRDRLEDWKKAQQTFRAVPGFVVNDKYLIKVGSIKSFDEFYSLVDYLLEKK